MSNKPLIVLIHGLHQHGVIMQPLAKKLQRYGFNTHKHSYRSVLDPLAQHSLRLNHWLTTHHNPNIPVHLVGHSLGGLVIRDFISRYPKWQIGHCVTLGTPHIGSVTAKYTKKIMSPLIGQSYFNGLDGSVPPLPDSISLGVIAGTSPYGLGQILISYHNKQLELSDEDRQNDGTVYVSETRLPNAKDHLILPVSHTGMLWDENVAKQTAYFIKHGQFKK